MEKTTSERNNRNLFGMLSNKGLPQQDHLLVTCRFPKDHLTGHTFEDYLFRSIFRCRN